MSPPDEIASIVGNLKALLNTRKGDGVTAPNFGVTDFSDICHSFPEGISVLQRSIRQTILEFEPRLKNVTVRHMRDDETPLILKFEISAQLVGQGGGTLKFRTHMTPGGQFDVR